MDKLDGIGIQQNIQICYRNLLRLKREKTEKHLSLVTEENRINDKIQKVVGDLIEIDEQISKLRTSCKNPEHDLGDGCPDCGNPF